MNIRAAYVLLFYLSFLSPAAFASVSIAPAGLPIRPALTSGCGADSSTRRQQDLYAVLFAVKQSTNVNRIQDHIRANRVLGR